MLCMTPSTGIESKNIRPLLHAEIDKLRDEHLELAHRLFLKFDCSR